MIVTADKPYISDAVQCSKDYDARKCKISRTKKWDGYLSYIRYSYEVTWIPSLCSLVRRYLRTPECGSARLHPVTVVCQMLFDRHILGQTCPHLAAPASGRRSRGAIGQLPTGTRLQAGCFGWLHRRRSHRFGRSLDNDQGQLGA